MYMASEWIENLSMSLYNLISTSLRLVPLPAMYLLQEHRSSRGVAIRDSVDLLQEVFCITQATMQPIRQYLSDCARWRCIV
jgi:hypothetical protein